MAADPYRYFRPEAGEIIEQFSRGMLDLEKGGDGASTLQRLLRLAHTLKGAARIVKQAEIASHAHAIEDILSPLRATPERVGRGEIDAVLEHIDAVGAQLRTLSAPLQSGQTPTKSEAEEPAPRTIRADLAETDAMLDSLIETRALMSGVRTAADEINGANTAIELLVHLLGSLPPEIRNGRPSLQSPIAIAEELKRKFDSIARALDSSLDRMDRELRQLRERAERLRLMPAADLFIALERTARDTARAVGKQITFTANGDDVRLDAHILETLQRALIQIVRNAVAHGIEMPADRRAAGKPASGSVSITIARRGRQITFRCRDDGRGLDLERVRASALQRGLVGADGKELGSGELMRLLLRGGISTSATVTEEAGRGIGLDIVREGIERLGGSVECQSTPGLGTTFELIIPPSLTSLEALLVDAGAEGSVMAIPLAAVRATCRSASSGISVTASGASILYDEAAIPFLPLATALDDASWPRTKSWATVIIGGSEGAAAIGVERLLGTANIVIRPLPQHMHASPIIAAASLDADGNPQLVLDAERLIEAARNGSGTLDKKAPKVAVLVVDDSLTTRMLEQGILEAAGFEVETAVSGEEGIERLRNHNFAVILVDVEMPGMDGFTFIERIKSNPATRNIPAILVTSLNEPSHRERGRAVGAHGYIVKSEFNQAELLAMIRPLVA
ncbi:MAG: response regulator [Alphaproteobacteria bacterium]